MVQRKMARARARARVRVPGAGAEKPKRVRTGCLTCRERHLKCDEAGKVCNKCRKSNRVCKRGIRLNFIDLWEEAPPNPVSFFGTAAWRVEFLDESRDIASEYRGGVEKYPPLYHEREYVPAPGMERMYQQDTGQNAPFDFATSAPPAPGLMQQQLPPMQAILPDGYLDVSQQQQPPSVTLYQNTSMMQESDIYPTMPAPGLPPNSGSTQDHSHYGSSGSASVAGQHTLSMTSYSTGPPSEVGQEKRDYLNKAEETLFMQVFVEEVGLWMDSMDSQKHFSRLLPFHALTEPMLLNAFLACGAKHLTLVNPAYSEQKALHYYDTATSYLLSNLQNPNRDTVICATTAVILNVYEIMSERALQRMNHIAGARALIKECGWNAKAQGIGSACFWLNVGLEVLSCLRFHWQVAWDPDDWQLDLDFTRELVNNREEVWTHRMLYIVGKVCNFRATIPRHCEADPTDQEIRESRRYEAWQHLWGMCESWNQGVPRTMHPMAYLYPQHTTSKSTFPEVWLVKRSTVVARLFYHMACLLLVQVNPYYAADHPEMEPKVREHSNLICGIVAHVKDRGVASVAIRSLAHAAEVLKDRREQEEVLAIFDKINKETGWRIGFVYKELKEKWGWNEPPSADQFAQMLTSAAPAKQAQEEQQRQLQEQAQAAQQNMQLQQGFDFNQQQVLLQQQSSGTQSVPPALQPMRPAPQQQQNQQMPKKPPPGIPNPMYAKADFSLPQHPYQQYYTPPANVFANGQQGGGGMWYNS